MDIGLYSDLFEQYPGAFDKFNITNIGSCVSNAHILGAAVKVASIFAKRKLRANYQEIADILDISVNTVKTRVFYAKSALRKVIGKLGVTADEI